LLYEILTVGKLNYKARLPFKYSLLFYFQDQKRMGKFYQLNIFLSLCHVTFLQQSLGEKNLMSISTSQCLIMERTGCTVPSIDQ